MADALDRTENGTSALRNISWCLSNFMKGLKPPHFPHVALGVPALIRAIQRTDMDVVINDIIWGISFFTQTAEEENLRCLVATGGVPRIIQLIEHAQMQIGIPALRTIGNLLSASKPDLPQVAIDAGILQAFGRLIDHPKQVMRKEVVWSLANVTADSADRVKACL